MSGKEGGMLMYRVPLCTSENACGFFPPVYVDEREIFMQNGFSFMQCSLFPLVYFVNFSTYEM